MEKYFKTLAFSFDIPGQRKEEMAPGPVPRVTAALLVSAGIGEVATLGAYRNVGGGGLPPVPKAW
jgi:hypothetical protein